MINSHPALKCSSPQAPVSEWFKGDDFHHNGAFFLMDCFNFYNGFGRPRPVPSQSYPPGYRHNAQDAYKFFLDIGPIRNIEEKIFKGDVKFWTELMSHPNYDAWWQARSVPAHAKNVKCAVMTVGGLFDAEDLYGAIHVYQGVERLNPGIENGLVMGPWTHGGWGGSAGDKLGDLEFGSKTSPEYQEQVELPFLRKYLKGEGDFKLAEARIFETGANTWHVFSAWPPKEAKRSTLYFGADGSLKFSKPSGNGFEEYVSDPAKPLPYVDGTRFGRPSEYMDADQRFATRRPDVLTFRSEPLTQPLRLAGPVLPNLFVTLTGTDADFVVKLIDEWPADAPPAPPGTQGAPVMAGYQMMVRGEIMRGRFRNSFEKPEAFVPGRVTPVKFYVPDICHTFKAGHRVVVQVQSSWFPLADRNPQTFVDIYKAKESDFKKATIRVLCSAANPSGVEVGVLP
jgi:putative CocE/NonD family hydrolase